MSTAHPFCESKVLTYAEGPDKLCSWDQNTTLQCIAEVKDDIYYDMEKSSSVVTYFNLVSIHCFSQTLACSGLQQIRLQTGFLCGHGWWLLHW